MGRLVGGAVLCMALTACSGAGHGEEHEPKIVKLAPEVAAFTCSAYEKRVDTLIDTLEDLSADGSVWTMLMHATAAHASSDIANLAERIDGDGAEVIADVSDVLGFLLDEVTDTRKGNVMVDMIRDEIVAFQGADSEVVEVCKHSEAPITTFPEGFALD